MGRAPAGYTPMPVGTAYRRGGAAPPPGPPPGGDGDPPADSPSGLAAVHRAVTEAAEAARASQASAEEEAARAASGSGVPPLVIPSYEVIQMGEVQTHCVTQSLIAVVGGGVMGLLFGVFMGSMDTGAGGNALLGGVRVEPDKSALQVVREMGRSVRVKSVSYAKSFAWMGFLFAGSECVVEKWRGRTDMANSVSAGCFTGAALAYGSGPKGMCFGCAGFAAFSALIDKVMGRH